MKERRKQIGFSQRIQLAWLEKTANLVLAGNDKAEIENALQEMLRDKLSVGRQSKRGNREKAITILMKIWATVPEGLEPVRDDGLQLFRNLPKSDHLPVHWGMATTVYPFLLAVSASTGRLLRLQGTASAAQVQRRVREKYGERETVSRAARRVLRSFVDWGLLAETGERGVYTQGQTHTIHNPELIVWLVEATLRAEENGSCPVKSILQSPALFPFTIETISSSVLSMSGKLEIVRHGLDDEMVVLRAAENADTSGRAREQLPG